jgi:aerobic-type carbon monoxide dehydrogenase small subunit (CoxS/CutS family)
MDVTVNVKLNGVSRRISTERDRSLLDVLREDFQMTGTHFGCGQGDCGACSVLIDGKRAFSCSTTVSDLDGKSITTIEGLEKDNRLHPIQRAFLDEGAYQCGYCVSGMIMAAAALLNEHPHPTLQQIKEGMNGNLCRCCGYVKIINAVQRAAGGAA